MHIHNLKQDVDILLVLASLHKSPLSNTLLLEVWGAKKILESHNKPHKYKTETWVPSDKQEISEIVSQFIVVIDKLFETSIVSLTKLANQ